MRVVPACRRKQVGIAILLSLAVAGCASERPRTWWPAAIEPAARSSSSASPSAAADPTFAAADPTFAAADPSFAGVGTRERGPDGGDASRMEMMLGARFLDSGDWEPVDDQLVFGFDLSYEPPDSLFGVEVGLQVAYDDEDGGDVRAGTGELHAGLRRTFARRSRLQPYVGAGVSVINLEVDLPGVGDGDDQTFAGYAHGGLVLFLGEAIFIGLDARSVFGSDIDLDGVSGDVDSTQVALVFGVAL